VGIYGDLKRKGYLVYIVKARIDNALWLRLKVGFFDGVTPAGVFGAAFSRREGFDFFVTRADVLAADYRGRFQIITTPSDIWWKKDQTLRHLFSFDLPQTAGDHSVPATPVISADGRRVVFNYRQETVTLALAPVAEPGAAADTAAAAFENGRQDLEKGDLDNALLHFSNALALNPDFIQARVHRATVFRQKTLYAEAIADFNRAIRLKPDDAELYNMRGFTWYKKGDAVSALADYNRALALNPRLAEAYFNRCVVRYRDGLLDPALNDCSRALQLDPSHDDAYSVRGLVRLQKGELDQAIKDCDRALKINPRNIAAYSTLGVIWLQKGALDWACADLGKACELGNCETLDTVREKGYCPTQP